MGQHKNHEKIDQDSSIFADFFSFLRRLRSRLASSPSSSALTFFSFFRCFLSASSAPSSATVMEVSASAASDFRLRFFSFDFSGELLSAALGCSTFSTGVMAGGVTVDCPVGCWQKSVRCVYAFI